MTDPTNHEQVARMARSIIDLNEKHPSREDSIHTLAPIVSRAYLEIIEDRKHVDVPVSSRRWKKLGVGWIYVWGISSLYLAYSAIDDRDRHLNLIWVLVVGLGFLIIRGESEAKS